MARHTPAMSFAKLLLTVAVIAIIWFGFKYLTRMAEIRRRGNPPPSPRGPEPAKPSVEGVEDMVRCRVCDTWQPARTAKSCGRADCPY